MSTSNINKRVRYLLDVVCAHAYGERPREEKKKEKRKEERKIELAVCRT